MRLGDKVTILEVEFDSLEGLCRTILATITLPRNEHKAIGDLKDMAENWGKRLDGIAERARGLME